MVWNVPLVSSCQLSQMCPLQTSCLAPSLPAVMGHSGEKESLDAVQVLLSIGKREGFDAVQALFSNRQNIGMLSTLF